MFLNNYHHLKKKEIYAIILLVTFSFFARIPVIIIFGDTSLDNEWGVLVNNLIEHGTLAIDYLNRNLLKYLLPNVLMPPLYAYYLYFFSIFNLEGQNYINLILLSQIILASISVIVFYKINKLFFSQKISFYSSLLFSLFPLHVFACSQISSISLQICITILFFYFFFQFIEKKNLISIIFFSFTAGLLILLRGEFIAILALSIVYLIIFFKVSIKNVLLIILISVITISPYLIRNILVFEKVTITQSFGYNLWKGNNPNATVEGTKKEEIDLLKRIKSIQINKFYGINFDKVYLDKAIEYIKEEPARYLILFAKKIMSFLLIDIRSSQPNYYNPLHYLPVLLIGVTSLIGIIISDKKSYKLNYLILIFFTNIFIFSVFFILPRYKLAILPLQIIFTNILIQYINKKFFNKNKIRS
jgi:4-amino-4-deoxy-L-arabinose transferase-like glycosyltransferase